MTAWDGLYATVAIAAGLALAALLRRAWRAIHPPRRRPSKLARSAADLAARARASGL